MNNEQEEEDTRIHKPLKFPTELLNKMNESNSITSQFHEAEKGSNRLNEREPTLKNSDLFGDQVAALLTMIK